MQVLFRKVMGVTTFGQVSLFFTLIGIFNVAFLWPICLILYFSGAESISWVKLPWTALFVACILHLGGCLLFPYTALSTFMRSIFNSDILLFLAFNMLGNFSIALTYDLFITLGLITAVPVSAGESLRNFYYKIFGSLLF